MSLRAVAAEMAARDVLNERGKPFNAKSVAVMLAYVGAFQTRTDQSLAEQARLPFA
jgi:hypothetical protein